MPVLFLLLIGARLAPANQKPDIVVKGYAPWQLRETIKSCNRRKCSDADYANTILAAANAAFVNGDYLFARNTLDTAVRHLDGVKAAPKLRAAVLQAQSVVAEHEGDRKEAEGASRRAVYALGHAGPGNAAEEVSARMNLGDLYERAGRPLDAHRAFAEAAKIADAIGSDDLKAAAEIHEALLDYHQGATRGPLTRLQAIVDSPKPLMEVTRTAAAITVARIARKTGDMGPTNALIAKVAQHPATGEPLLLYAKPIPDPADALRDPDLPTQLFIPTNMMDHGLLRWADVGYWIRSSGRVEDVEILRGTPDRHWLDPVLQSIASRVYVASAEAPGHDGYYIVERFTLGFPKLTPTGSLVPRRAGLPTLTELRLVAGDAPPPPGGQAPAAPAEGTPLVPAT